MKQTYFILITLVLASFFAQAQSNILGETRNWTSFENIDLYSNQTLPDTFLITINSTSLTLKNGDMEKNFDLQNIQGAWSNLSEAGQLTFDVPLKDFTGKGSIQNEAGVLSLIIDFSEKKNWMKRKFIVKN